MGRRELLEGEEAPPFRSIISGAVLRSPLRDVGEWRRQPEHLLMAGEREDVTVHVLPRWVENGYRGELIEEYGPVDRLQRAYDAVRDLAMSPAESRKFVLRLLEERPCDPST